MTHHTPCQSPCTHRSIFSQLKCREVSKVTRLELFTSLGRHSNYDTYVRKSGSLDLISARLFIRPVWWCACADTSQDGRMHCPSNVLFTIVPHCARRTVNGILLGQCVLPSCDVYARAHQQTGRINNHADISFKDPFFLAYVQWLVPEPLAPCMRKCNKILWTQSIVSSHSKGNENLP